MSVFPFEEESRPLDAGELEKFSKRLLGRKSARFGKRTPLRECKPSTFFRCQRGYARLPTMLIVAN